MLLSVSTPPCLLPQYYERFDFISFIRLRIVRDHSFCGFLSSVRWLNYIEIFLYVSKERMWNCPCCCMFIGF